MSQMIPNGKESTMDIVFVSLDGAFSQQARRRVNEKFYGCDPNIRGAINVHCMKNAKYVDELWRGASIAYVSPANSMGFMDGGIDHLYSREMFPGIERHVKNRIGEIGLRTKLERFYLPVGCASVIDATRRTNEYVKATRQWLISAPTMFLPHDVSTTANAYLAFLAVLTLVEKKNKSKRDIDVIVCPGLCCGYGKMKVEQAAEQVSAALYDFVVLGVRTPDVSPDQHVVLSRDVQQINSRQPDFYDNLEIKDIAVVKSVT